MVAVVERRAGGGIIEPVPIDWKEARHALSDQVARVASLLHSVRNPLAPAIGEWNLSEVAMHLYQAWLIVTSLVREDPQELHRVWPHLASRPGRSLVTDIWDFPGITRMGVNADAERDLTVLSDRIEAQARSFLGSLNEQFAAESCAWVVEGVVVGTPMLLCHLLNEMIVHGYDMARADGKSWPIPRSHAALVIDGFLVPIVSALGPRTMVDQSAARGLAATYELHVRGGGRYLFVFDDGTVAIEVPGTRRVDCHISADPAAMMLVAWRRRSQWAAIGLGQLVAWGRKPWLATRFPNLMRNP